jgi:4-amino-4-deoxy-L-arabinose transferase
MTPHLITALLHLLAAALCFGIAWRQYLKRQYNIAALLLTLGGLALRLFMAGDMYLHEWDERYHALVAKNLTHGWLQPKLYPVALLPYDVTQWSSNYIWLHKQPLPLWCMAAAIKLFGATEMAIRLPSVLVSSIGIFITWLTGRLLFNEKVGLLAAFFCAVNGLVLDVTSGRAATDHIDVFFMFFVQLGMLFAVLSSTRNSLWPVLLTGVCIGLAVLCKWLPAFIVLPVWLALNYRHKSVAALATGAVIITVVGAAVFLPWQWYMYQHYPLEYSTEMLHNYRHLTEALDNQTGGVFYFFAKLHINVNELFWPAFVWFGYLLYRRDRVDVRLALLVWMLVPFVFFTIAKTKMQAYLLFTFPALFIMLAEFAVYLLQPVAGKQRRWLQQAAFAAIIILAVRFSVERIKPMQNQEQQLAWAGKLKEIGKTATGNAVYFNVKHYVEGMFYTNAVMYERTPTPEEVEQLRGRGYRVVINYDPDL